MKCPYCGKEVEEGSKFCDGCGAKLDETKNDEKKYDYVYDSQKKSKAGLVVAIIIISILLITGIILGIVLLTNNGDKSSSNRKEVIKTDDNNSKTEKDTNDSKDYSKNIKYSEYKLEDGKIVVILKNNNSTEVSIDATVEYYNKENVMVDHDSESLLTVAPGQETAIRIYGTDREYDNYKLKIEASKDKYMSYYKSYYKEVKISSKNNAIDEEIEVTFSNNSDKKIETAKVAAVFYKNGKVVGYSYDGEYDIEAGKSVAMYIDYPYDSKFDDIEFDDYKVYLVEAYSYTF